MVQLAAAYENPNEIILVQEYISGGELFQIVADEEFQLNEHDCTLFIKQICQILEESIFP